jgi:hypothetical protein
MQFVTRDRPHKLLTEIQTELNAGAAVKGKKASRYQHRHPLGGGKLDQLVSSSVAKKIDVPQGHPLIERVPPFPMPGRPIHPQLAFQLANDDPVIAQNAGLTRLLPELTHGRLSRSRVAQEENALPVSDQPAPVQLDPPAQRQQMNHQ